MVEVNVELVDSEIMSARTLIKVPSERGITQFTSPIVGPNSYMEVGRKILESGLVLPTFGDLVQLIHAAYFPKKDGRQLKEIRDIIARSDCLWGYTVNVWTKEGVYSIDDAGAEGQLMAVDLGQLEEIVRRGKEVAPGVVISGDGAVRFASKSSYVLGNHTPKSLEKAGSVIAMAGGKENATRLAQLSGRFSGKPCTDTLDLFSKRGTPQVGVSAFGADEEGFIVMGRASSGGQFGPGYSSGVQK